MNQVVNFLSLLAVTEEQGGIKRMLGVCAEFERIARVVLEKGDKESHSRRKRRSSKLNETNNSPHLSPQNVPQKRTAPPTPQSNNAPTPQNMFSPTVHNFTTSDLNNAPFNPNIQGFSPSLSDMTLPMDFSGADYSTLMSTPTTATMDSFPNGLPDGGQQQFSPETLNMGSFQQPFVPQDLWQMPMTFEWDWTDMGVAANGFPSASCNPGQGQGQGQDGSGMSAMNGRGSMQM